MIKKIISVKGVGKFDQNFKALELKKISIIYGENGRGKSTISAILRSLCSGDPSHILERQTLKSTSSQEVRVLTDGLGVITFKGDKWSKVIPNLEIFDSWFIDNNVYSGTDINVDHRRNLHHFVIGEDGVEYAKKIDEFDRSIKLITDDISKKESVIKRYASEGSLEVKDFVNLVQDLDPNIDQKLEEKTKELNTLKKAAEISKKSSLECLFIPKIPRIELEGLLATTLSDISKDAEKNTHDHISRYMDDKGEEWIQKGIKYIKDEKCPFCNQAISNSILITAYQSYFDDRYILLKKEISTFSDEIKKSLSERNLSIIQNTIYKNDSLADYWSDYINFEYQTIDLHEMCDNWDLLRSRIDEYLQRKMSNPLEPIEFKSDLLVAFRLFNFGLESIGKYNNMIKKINEFIESKRISVECGDIKKTEHDIKILNVKKIRFNLDISNLCDEYKSLVEEKDRLTKGKKTAKENLDEYTEEVFTCYESSINTYLEKSGADFKIEGIKTRYPGGRPSVNYNFSINGAQVDLSRGEANVPSFKNTLSEGDKSTLAFVFFLSKLDQDPNLRDKIIVFDDPISSLDSNRKNFTQQQVLSLAERCKQVIVLSHDIQFSRNIFNGIQGDICTLIIRRKGFDSIIETWDLEKETRGPYFKNYDVIHEYINSGPQDENHLREVARSIRPLLEGYYRIKFPKDFGNKDWLGDFLKKIKRAGPGEPLLSMTDKYEELNSINEYSKKYHHDQNPGADLEPINDRELTSFAKRTLEIIYY